MEEGTTVTSSRTAKTGPTTGPTAALPELTPENLAAYLNGTLTEGVTEIPGLDFVDKATLVGKPMMITRYRFRTGSNDVHYVEIEAILIDGRNTVVAFNDSSTANGIRPQMIEIDRAAGEPGRNIAFDEWVSTRLLVRNGLRVSEYDRPVSDPGGQRNGSARTGRSRTYYLTASGK